MSEVEYWTRFYNTLADKTVPSEASTFAVFVKEWLIQSSLDMQRISVVDLGCGTGRDSRYFASLGAQVVGIDQVKQESKTESVQYIVGDLADLQDTEIRQESVDVMYCRFVIHSLEKESASALYKWVERALKKGGMFFIEARSIADPLYLLGERNHVDPNVSVHGHFRRFIVLEELMEELKQVGLHVVFHFEGKNLSIHGDDNPVLVRVVCRK